MGDDVDLQEIFADYYLTTEDYSSLLPPPDAAPSSSSGNTTSAQQQQQQQIVVQQQLLAAQQHQQQQHQQLAANAMAAQAQAAAAAQAMLPTRQGIKTAWHTGSLPVIQQQQQQGGGGLSQRNATQLQPPPPNPAKRMSGEELYLPTGPVQQQQQQQQQLEVQGGGGSSATTMDRKNTANNDAATASITSLAHQQQQQQQWALAQAASGFGGLSSRLGFTTTTLPPPSNTANTAVMTSMGSNNTMIGQQQQQQDQQQGVMLPLGGIHFPVVGMGLKFGAGGNILSQVGSSSMAADPTTTSANNNSNNVNVNSNIAAMSNNLALALSSQGVVMNHHGNTTTTTTDPSRLALSNMQYGVNHNLPYNNNNIPSSIQLPHQQMQQQQSFISGGMMRMNQECEEQLASERRLRNREHAKRSRVRKKFMLEGLQLQVRGLQDENSTLRMLIQQHIPHEALNIIDTCCSKSVLFADPMSMMGGGGSGGFDDSDDETEDGNKVVKRKRMKKDEESEETNSNTTPATPLLRSDFSLIESLTSGQQNFVLSDPRLPDNPIVYASPGFYELTGYTREQVLGRNCRFLQGTGTNRKAVDILRTAVANGSDATVCLLNYKADGTPFWNQLFVAALRDGDNCIVNYVSMYIIGTLSWTKPLHALRVRYRRTHMSTFISFCSIPKSHTQVGVQTMIEPNAGATALEDKVNAAHPILVGSEEDGGGGGDNNDKDQDEGGGADE